MSDDIAALAEAVLEQLPTEFKDRLENLAIIVDEDHPIDGRGGQFAGQPFTSPWRGPMFYAPLSRPAEIVLFEKPIRAQAGADPELLQAVVREVMIHELGHYFGLSHADMDAQLR
jgi:predicted Zn-dependent protease with MMP-like domain